VHLCIEMSCKVYGTEQDRCAGAVLSQLFHPLDHEKVNDERMRREARREGNYSVGDVVEGVGVDEREAGDEDVGFGVAQVAQLIVFCCSTISDPSSASSSSDGPLLMGGGRDHGKACLPGRPYPISSNWAVKWREH
jgi:hypothetical protein